MRPLLLLTFLCLTACSSASPRYMGIAPQQTIVDGWPIDVFRKGNKAQAIRLNREIFPTATDMAIRGTVAIEQSTGCKIVSGSLKGDNTVVNARLRCAHR